MSDPKISIIDYGVGNLHSLYKAVSLFSKNVSITKDVKDILSSDAIILPGDGAFEAGMDGLMIGKLLKPVKDFIASGKPVLGICLGAQILLSKSFEFGEFEGLNIISGNVIKFSKLKNGTKIPHIGWNTLSLKNKVSIFKGLDKKPYVYFVHSYVMEPKEKKTILATSEYGGKTFPAVIGLGNVYGCQFHPEKSAEAGLKIIENFVSLI